MKKKKSKEPSKYQKNLLCRITEKWRGRLFLQEWYIDIDYMKKDYDDEDVELRAEIKVQDEYKRCQIKIYPCFWKNSRDSMERIIVHELCHMITQPAWNMISDLQNGFIHHKPQARDLIETLTQRIANAVYLGWDHDK